MFVLLYLMPIFNIKENVKFKVTDSKNKDIFLPCPSP